MVQYTGNVSEGKRGPVRRDEEEMKWETGVRNRLSMVKKRNHVVMKKDEDSESSLLRRS